MIPLNHFKGDKIMISNLPQLSSSPVSGEELGQRLGKVRAAMEENRLDFYVATDPINIYYLTGFRFMILERPFILIIPSKGNMTLLLPGFDRLHAEVKVAIKLEYAEYAEFPAPEGVGWADVYQKLFPSSAKVGIESSVPISIEKRTPGTRVMIDIIDEVRIVKSEYEIGRLIHAGMVATLGMQKIFEATRPGVLEIMVNGAVNVAMIQKALSDIPEMDMLASRFIGAVLPPSISGNPHIIPTALMPMEEGGPQIAMIIPIIDGYGVEVQRTFFLGKVPEYAKRPYEVMMRARAMAYGLAKPGAIVEDIDRRTRQIIIDAGYESICRTGHGVGLAIHEKPFIGIGSKTEIIPGMVLSMLPSLYIGNQGGYRHSDTILITESGSIRLTKTPDSLEEMIIKM